MVAFFQLQDKNWKLLNENKELLSRNQRLEDENAQLCAENKRMAPELNRLRRENTTLKKQHSTAKDEESELLKARMEQVCALFLLEDHFVHELKFREGAFLQNLGMFIGFFYFLR